MVKHPNVSAWQRQHDGTYQAEKNGWELRVKWTPEAPGQHRGFSWVAELPTGQTLRDGEIHEEIEEAMAEAEEAVGGEEA